MAHYRHTEIVDLLKAGHSNAEIGRRLGVERQTVGRIRRDAGITPTLLTKHPSIDAVFNAHAVPTTDGHMEWTGARATTSNTPILRHREKTYTAARVAFRRRTGREPDGYAFAECGLQHCVAPEHVEDEPGRHRAREQYRYLTGRSEVPAVCRRGHDQHEHGRLDSDGWPYCAICKNRSRAAHASSTTPPVA